MFFASMLNALYVDANLVADYSTLESQTVTVEEYFEKVDCSFITAKLPFVEVFDDYPSNKPMCHYYVEVEIYQNGVLVGVHIYEGEDYCETMAALMSVIIDRYL